jgi:hypothetical protein
MVSSLGRWLGPGKRRSLSHRAPLVPDPKAFLPVGRLPRAAWLPVGLGQRGGPSGAGVLATSAGCLCHFFPPLAKYPGVLKTFPGRDLRPGPRCLCHFFYNPPGKAWGSAGLAAPPGRPFGKKSFDHSPAERGARIRHYSHGAFPWGRRIWKRFQKRPPGGAHLLTVRRWAPPGSFSPARLPNSSPPLAVCSRARSPWVQSAYAAGGGQTARTATGHGAPPVLAV